MSEMVQHWKGHWDLHLWMDQVYELKGGRGSPGSAFNEATVEITAFDIDALEEDMLAHSLPLGDTGPEHRESDLEFINKARTALAGGRSLYYVGWW